MQRKKKVNWESFSNGYVKEWANKYLLDPEMVSDLTGWERKLSLDSNLHLETRVYRTPTLPKEMLGIGFDLSWEKIRRHNLMNSIYNKFGREDPLGYGILPEMDESKPESSNFLGINLYFLVRSWYRVPDNVMERIVSEVTRKYGKGDMNPFYSILSTESSPVRADAEGRYFCRESPLYSDFDPEPTEELIEVFNQLTFIYNSIRD